MRALLPVRSCLALFTTCLLCLSAAAQAAPLLNGMAVHQELGKDRFIGAIYSETLTSDAGVLLAADIPMRMEMKITADRGMAARRFSRMWIEGMAINIRSDALTAQADNMVDFTNMFKERLLENDQVVFALTPAEGVAISVNGIELGQIDDDEFFSLLVSTWVGRVPLSSSFRDQLLAAGEVTESLVARYQSIQPSPERTDQVAAWTAPPPAPEPAPAVTQEPEPEPTVSDEPNVAVAAPVIEPPKIELPPAASSSVASAVADEPEPVSSAQSSSVAAASSSAPLPAPEPEPEDETDEDYVPTFTAESLLASQRYFSTLVRKVQLEIKYPRRALQRGYEGFIRIAVTLDRSGNLLGAEMLEESEHGILNDEAMESVEDAAPFAEIPGVIGGLTHEFTIPITFALEQ